MSKSFSSAAELKIKKNGNFLSVPLSVVEDNIRDGWRPEIITDDILGNDVAARCLYKARQLGHKPTDAELRKIIIAEHKRVVGYCEKVVERLREEGEIEDDELTEGLRYHLNRQETTAGDVVGAIGTFVLMVILAILTEVISAPARKREANNNSEWGMKNPLVHSNALEWTRTRNGDGVSTHFSRWSSGFRYASHSVCGDKMYIIATNGKYQETVEVNLRSGSSMNKGRRSIY